MSSLDNNAQAYDIITSYKIKFTGHILFCEQIFLSVITRASDSSKSTVYILAYKSQNLRQNLDLKVGERLIRGS